MKISSINLTLTAALGLVISAQSAPVLFPNGDFETIDGDQWGEASDGPQAFNYPTTGGNPGGFGQIVSSGGGGYAVLISNNDAPYPLSSLGLTAGETYTFSYDMIASVAGANKGGIKVESWTASGPLSDSGEKRVTASSTGWESYTLQYQINPAATHIKLVPLWTPNETVGFDNIKVDNTPVPPPPFVPAQIPNGGFESDPIGVGWNTVETTPSYKTTGGNPGRYVELTDGVGAFPVLYAFDNAEVTFASLGLAPGDTYFVEVDMKIITAGSDPTSPIGGIRLAGPSAYVVESYPTSLIGDGSTWETYRIEFTVPADADPPTPAQLKFGLRPGKTLSGAKIGFDNVRIVIPQAVPFTAEIKTGTVVSWEPTGPEYSYQAQKSSDNAEWTNFGPLVTGDQVNSSFDAEGAAFYQVLEYSLVPLELVTDPGFEDSSETWLRLGDAESVLIDNPSIAHEGSKCVRMAVDSGTTTVPVTSFLQQPGIGILEGDVLDFTFWANVESNVDANIYYSIQWFTEEGAFITQEGGPISAPSPGWFQVTRLGIEPPSGTGLAVIQFGCVTGAVAGQSGSVLIDDVSFVVPESLNPLDIPATSTPGLQVSWPSKNGSSYQAKSSNSLGGFTNLGPVIVGDGEVKSVTDTFTDPSKFYQVEETP